MKTWWPNCNLVIQSDEGVMARAFMSACLMIAFVIYQDPADKGWENDFSKQVSDRFCWEEGNFSFANALLLEFCSRISSTYSSTKHYIFVASRHGHSKDPSTTKRSGIYEGPGPKERGSDTRSRFKKMRGAHVVLMRASDHKCSVVMNAGGVEGSDYVAVWKSGIQISI